MVSASLVLDVYVFICMAKVRNKYKLKSQSSLLHVLMIIHINKHYLFILSLCYVIRRANMSTQTSTSHHRGESPMKDYRPVVSNDRQVVNNIFDRSRFKTTTTPTTKPDNHRVVDSTKGRSNISPVPSRTEQLERPYQDTRHTSTAATPIVFTHNTKVPFSKTPTEEGSDSIESSHSSSEEDQHIPAISKDISTLEDPLDTSSDDDDTNITNVHIQMQPQTQEKENLVPKETTETRKKRPVTNTPLKLKLKVPTISERSGLSLPVGRISAFSKMHLGKEKKLSMEAKVLLTAQIQLLLKNLTLAALEKKNETDPNRKTISKEDLNVAIMENLFFSAIADGLMIPTSDSGVVNLPLTKKMKKEASLFKKTNTAKRTTKTRSSDTTKIPKPGRKQTSKHGASESDESKEEEEEEEDSEILNGQKNGRKQHKKKTQEPHTTKSRKRKLSDLQSVSGEKEGEVEHVAKKAKRKYNRRVR